MHFPKKCIGYALLLDSTPSERLTIKNDQRWYAGILSWRYWRKGKTSLRAEAECLAWNPCSRTTSSSCFLSVLYPSCNAYWNKSSQKSIKSHMTAQNWWGVVWWNWTHLQLFHSGMSPHPVPQVGWVTFQRDIKPKDIWPLFASPIPE